MKKETWSNLSMINLVVLMNMGLIIWGYVGKVYSDWHLENQTIGDMIFMVAAAGWIALTAESTAYLHSKSR